MTKVCYFIQSYKQFEQILRLVTTLRRLSPNAVIILSHSLKGCPLDESSLKDQGVHIRYAEGGRGTFSLTKAYLDAIEWLLSNEIEFDWFINLTAQDYPIKPKGYIEEVLSTTEYDGFLEYFHVLSSECPWSREELESRYFYQYHPIIKELSSYQKKLFAPLKLINRVQPYFRIRNDFDLRLGIFRGQIFHENFRCYGGSYFTVLSRKCVEYIRAFMTNNHDIIDYFKEYVFPMNL
jgi:Core-2/I-Branching enzyme.